MTQEPTGFSVFPEFFSLLTSVHWKSKIKVLAGSCSQRLNKGLLKNESSEIPHYSDLEVSPASVLPLNLQYIL